MPKTVNKNRNENHQIDRKKRRRIENKTETIILLGFVFEDILKFPVIPSLSLRS